MIRKTYIERVRRLIYGTQPTDDASVTENMVNNMLPDAIATAVKSNWTENIKMDGCACVNNSFYTSFSNIPITVDPEFGMYNVALPSLPIALGKNDGINAAYVLDDKNSISKPVIMLTVNQAVYVDNLPKMNGIFGWNEGSVFKLKSPEFPLYNCTAKIRMISTGSNDLNSEINVPAEFYPMMTDYLLKAFGVSQQQPNELVSDGVD